MTFLNGILAFGAIAALVPLLIHLLNRSRFKVVAWGAIHLLESVLRKNRKQVQLEQIILLIIRCIIPILLALALARMVVTEWGPFLNRIILPLVALSAYSKSKCRGWYCIVEKRNQALARRKLLEVPRGR